MSSFGAGICFQLFVAAPLLSLSVVFGLYLALPSFAQTVGVDQHCLFKSQILMSLLAEFGSS